MCRGDVNMRSSNRGKGCCCCLSVDGDLVNFSVNMAMIQLGLGNVSISIQRCDIKLCRVLEFVNIYIVIWHGYFLFLF